MVVAAAAVIVVAVIVIDVIVIDVSSPTPPPLSTPSPHIVPTNTGIAQWTPLLDLPATRVGTSGFWAILSGRGGGCR